MSNLAIKIDIDTLRGYMEGTPRLLALLRKHAIAASIFFSFGPDNSGKAIRRIFKKGFISKMFRTKAPSTYGLKTLFYGTLLPAPMIVASDPDIFKRACDDGHDCGVHAWDHVLTQDKLRPMSESDFESLYDKAAAMFEKISGRKPTCYAAPGWQVSEASLAAQERLNLKYASDTRGRCPFTPKYKSRAFSVPQIPTTLPTMDEMLGLEGVTDERVPDVWIGSLDKQWNVLTIHAEMEGLSKLGTFEIFLHKAKADGVRFMTLREVAERADISPGEIVEGELPGRAGSVALQNAV